MVGCVGPAVLAVVDTVVTVPLPVVVSVEATVVLVVDTVVDVVVSVGVAEVVDTVVSVLLPVVAEVLVGVVVVEVVVVVKVVVAEVEVVVTCFIASNMVIKPVDASYVLFLLSPTSTFRILPSFTSKVISVVSSYPFGACVSCRVYLPSGICFSTIA